MNIACLFLSWFICLDMCFGHTHTYNTYKLQDRNICNANLVNKLINIVSTKEIKLSFTNPINITQTWDFSTFRSVNGNCNFRVKTDRGLNGIYAVITKLKFRKNKELNSCIDYIEFSHSPRNTSGKICDEYGTASQPNKIYFYQGRFNEVLIKVFVNNQYKIDEPLQIELFLTRHGPCESDGFQCDPTNPNSCIFKALVGDNIPNCITNCSDEESCNYSENIKKKYTQIVPIDYSHVIISAITSLVFTMFAVGTIVYTCWKYWHVCHPRSIDQRQSNHDLPIVEMPETLFNGSITMAGEEDRPPSPKDLPPSYESLFPER